MEELRELLSRALSWADAHVSAEEVLTDYPAELQGRIIPGQNYSPYQLLEHLRIAQKDILDFSRSSSFRHLNWPADYWPEKPEPPDSEAWDRSMKEFRFDREEMTILIQDESKDLFEHFEPPQWKRTERQIVKARTLNTFSLS